MLHRLPVSPASRRLGCIALLGFAAACLMPHLALAGPLSAGVARVDITNDDAGPVNDRLWVKALVLKDDAKTAAIVTVDAVAIEEIGSIKKEYLGNVRAQVKKSVGILPEHVLINASHCHGIVHPDVEKRTVEAIERAAKNLVPVTVGAGVGHEDRIQENRRLKLKNGKEIDLRRAYSMPPDADVAAVGPIDPEIGVLRLDRVSGGTMAVVYQFACHPIEGVPGGGNTADMTGFSSRVIEDALGEGSMAFFLQGCGGDINPAKYKDVDVPPDAEPLGNLLGLSTLKAVRKIEPKKVDTFKMTSHSIAAPRADLAGRIESLESELNGLVRSLRSTNINLKTFLPLMAKHKLSDDFPSYYSQRYLHDETVGRDGLKKLDATNRAQLEQYVKNILTMEEITRVQTNLALLKKNQAKNVAAGKRTIDVEILGLRVGDFTLVTYPGELVVQIGLNLKKASPHKPTFVSGYTNGYIYYCPTAEQLKNVGGAQEDSDCILAPEWQEQFETKALEILKGL